MDQHYRSIVIVGGGTAGWMAAAQFADFFARDPQARITVVESDAIATVGVGEATVPQIRYFLQRLNIDEAEFVRAVHGTYKLAIAFDGWAGEGSRFYHPFGEHGTSIAGIGFRHHWQRMRTLGRAAPIDTYCLASRLSDAGRFAVPRRDARGEYLFNYALHFDAGLVARYLRRWAEGRGVQRVEGKVIEAVQDGESGNITALRLERGERVEGDFFIDCSGFAGLLIERTLAAGFEDWTHWLPCDRAIAVPCESRLAPAPYTQSKATAAGWQWRIPLQHRVGNGHVYCSAAMSDDAALTSLEAELEGPITADPRVIPFRTGVRRQVWKNNVYALGLASGFLEPLESTSIYLVQKALSGLLSSFPTRATAPAIRDVVNARQLMHWAHLRDFIVLHYALNGRVGEPFWDQVRNMPLPDTLAAKIAAFREAGRLDEEREDFFQPASWLALFSGLGVEPRWYHPAADNFAAEDVERELKAIDRAMGQAVETAVPHAEFVARNVAIEPLPA